MDKKMLKLDLQMFADESEPSEDTGNPEGESQSEDIVEFDEKQKEQVNRLVAQAKSKAKAEQEKAIAKAVEKALEKERSYAKMSKAEQEAAELSEREQALAEREQAIAKLELQAEVKADVQAKGLPVELVDLLTTTDDKEQILESVNAIKKLVDEAITEGIKANARQDAPSESIRSYGERSSAGVDVASFARSQRIIK